MTILAASALMIAPVCMVAQAEPTTVQEFAEESIAILNDVATIFDKVTPATADECVAELNALKPRIAAVQAAEAKLTDEEKQAAEANLSDEEKQALEEKVTAAMGRMMAAAMKLQMTIQSASPEDQAKLMKLVEAMQNMDM